MFRIENITSDAKQKQRLLLPDGTAISLSIAFVEMQLGWFITELVYGSFTVNHIRISNNPNILRQFKNLIPFGLACFSSGSREPSLLQDFSSGNSILYILSEAEVLEYEGILSGQV